MGEDDGDGVTLESLAAGFGFRDVGRRALRGVASGELIADYPDLRDEDIELARRFAEDEERAHGWRGRMPAFDEARFLRPRKPVVVSDFDVWVNDNNIPDTFEYGKGWWDYVELVRRFADRLDTDDVRVIGHYVIETPPPCELLPMPAVALTTPSVTFALRYDFGTWSLKHREISEWVLSVHRRTPYGGPLFGLIDESHDLRALGVDGLTPDYLFGSYRQDQARFSCIVRDEWDVATLMRILARDA